MPDREKVVSGLKHCLFDHAALDILDVTNHCNGCPYYTSPECERDLYYDALELLKGQDECGWVNVKDKVPDNQRPVIVYVPPHVDGTKGTSLGYVGMAYYTSSGKGFWCGTDGNMYGAIGIIYPPTHWMEPPKEVSGDA